MARGRPESGKEKMLEAALKVFSDHGYRRTTLDDVAKEAGVANSTLYNYFESKEDLYHQTCERAALAWQNWVKDRVAEVDSARDKFLTMGRESFSYLSRNTELRKLLQNDPKLFPLFEFSERYTDIDMGAVGMLRGVLEQGVREGVFRPLNFEQVTHVIFSIYKMFVISAFIEHPEHGEEELFGETLDMILDGLCARKSKGKVEKAR